MVYVLLILIGAFAALITGTSFMGSDSASIFSKTPPPAADDGAGSPVGGGYGGQCMTEKELEAITSQPTAFTCAGEEYVLAARNVVVDDIEIHPEKRLIERQNCAGIQYYSWYCHPPDYGSLWQNTLWKAVPDADKKIADGDKFNVYIKKNPDKDSLFVCSGGGSRTSSAGTALVSFAASEDDARTILVDDKEAVFNFSGIAQAIDVEEAPTRKKVSTIKLKTSGGEEEYDVWVNLLKAFSPDEDHALYLTKSGALPDSNRIPIQIEYKKYTITKVFKKNSERESLQLDTFRIVPTPSNPWWNIYLPESKPVVYLYPESKTTINVKVKPQQGKITLSDPPYPKDGWTVEADENSKISYKNTTYPYLYFETEVAGYEIPKEGFVYKNENIGEKLRTLVEKLGLRGREADEFIEYWVDRFKKDVNSDYIFTAVISQKEIDRVVPLEITPKPQTQIRVRLYFKGVEYGYSPKAPVLSDTIPARIGFTMVEWGGILD